MAGAGIPSYWGDEAASVLSASRSLPSLFALLGHIDAVHGTYYLFLHVWTGLFGTSEAVVRLPSAMAVGMAAAGTVVLGGRLYDRRLGVLAGLVFAILPEVTRMGVEARSYAFAMAAAVWLTAWFVALVRRGETRRRIWLLFGVAAAGAVYVFLYLALLLVAQLVFLLACRADRAVVRRWLEAVTLAALLAAPIVAAALDQRAQIRFLAERDYATPASVLVGQWFATPVFACFAWAFIVVALVAGFWSDRRRHFSSFALVLTWFAAPTLLILAGNAWVSPMYNLRYPSFCAPAVALLIALGIDRAASVARDGRWRTVGRIAATVVLVAVAAPQYAAQRGPYAKDGGADLRQTAEVVAAHATSGDGIVFDPSVKPSRRPRLSIDLYPERFAGLADLALVKPYGGRTSLWDRVAPVDAIANAIRQHDTVWVVESGADRTEVDAVRSLGYVVRRALPVHRTTVYELTREQP
ncbi:glycosyltransferase family 39 protein [Agromyces allii]|uniref:Glycosyltransferase family 39 protein n=1 Tax=Agromyces allii TaxID=393607 RepID=A0ABN2QLZ3_9MICO